MNLNPDLLEAVNGATFVLFFSMVIVIMSYLIRELRDHGYKRYRAQAAVSLLTIAAGETTKSGIIWWVRSSGSNNDWLVQNNDIFIGLGAALLVFGPLCYIRIWAPASLGEWPWISAGIVAAAMAFGGAVPAACAAIFLGILFFFSQGRKKNSDGEA